MIKFSDPIRTKRLSFLMNVGWVALRSTHPTFFVSGMLFISNSVIPFDDPTEFAERFGSRFFC
ncbi:Uncharacterized protein dnm_034910 [Desulfonema magnum]|uniref:Uncharacterized protein n=1 Tax=Desulfonema magnum TaxID=45655 RepID=A0A975BKX7_9BACT|nr:Uncharacterized protein dnm_034910 [Desulfonema magnum]